MRGFIFSILFSFIGLTCSVQAWAFPLPAPGFSPPEQNFGDVFTYLVPTYNFEGIVALTNCSGSIIRFETSKDTDPAMVLTNGHCVETGLTPANQIIFNRPSHRQFSVLDPQSKKLGQVKATKIIYSTMTNTDITLYQLQETFVDILKNFNVRPFTLASTHPQIQQPIEVVSGFWKTGYTCAIDKFIFQLKEGQWTFSDSIKYTQPGCIVIGGTSGSPIILSQTRTVIGINNTGNDGGEACTVDNPCEVSEDGTISAAVGDSYGQQTYSIYGCLDSNNEFDLSLSSCKLPR